MTLLTPEPVGRGSGTTIGIVADDSPELELAGLELAEPDSAAEVEIEAVVTVVTVVVPNPAAPDSAAELKTEAVVRTVTVVVPDGPGKTPGNTDW